MILFYISNDQMRRVNIKNYDNLATSYKRPLAHSKSATVLARHIAAGNHEQVQTANL